MTCEFDANIASLPCHFSIHSCCNQTVCFVPLIVCNARPFLTCGSIFSECGVFAPFKAFCSFLSDSVTIPPPAPKM